MSEKLTRRDFLKLATVGAATTAVLTGCGPDNRQQEGSVTFSHELTDCVASFDRDGFEATRLRYGLPEMRDFDIKLIDSNPTKKPEIDPDSPNWVNVTIDPEGRALITVDVGMLEEGFGLKATKPGEIDLIRSMYATIGFIAGYTELAVNRGEIDEETASQTVGAYFDRANVMQEEPFILIAGELPHVSPTMPLING